MKLSPFAPEKRLFAVVCVYNKCCSLRTFFVAVAPFFRSSSFLHVQRPPLLSGWGFSLESISLVSLGLPLFSRVTDVACVMRFCLRVAPHSSRLKAKHFVSAPPKDTSATPPSLQTFLPSSFPLSEKESIQKKKKDSPVQKSKRERGELGTKGGQQTPPAPAPPLSPFSPLNSPLSPRSWRAGAVVGRR